MNNNEIDLKFAPLHLDNAREVNSIRLVSDSGRLALAMLTDVTDGAHPVSVVSIDSSHVGFSRLLFKLESLFGVPSWDVANTQRGIAAVWTKPGSAISPLGYRTPDSVDKVLTGRYPSGVFQSPRFLRGGSDTAIVAIAYEENHQILAFFYDLLESGYSSYVSLPTAGTGILLDGLLLHQGSGYLLFTKTLAPGSRGPERKDARGESIQPGILRCLLLNNKFQTVGANLNPIGDNAIFEFDVDVSDGQVYLLATTNNGYIVAVGTTSEQILHWTTSFNLSAKTELVAPTVLAMGKTAFAAVIESATTEHPQMILIGQY